MKCACHEQVDTLINPRMQPQGKFEKEILVIGRTVQQQEDATGRLFLSSSGHIVRNSLKKAGLDVATGSNIQKQTDVDVMFHNWRRCGFDFGVEESNLKPCTSYMNRLITAIQPKVIVAIGQEVFEKLMPMTYKIDRATCKLMRGIAIPSYKHNCWVVPVLDSEALMMDERHQDFMFAQFDRDIKNAVEHSEIPLPKKPEPKEIVALDTAEEIEEILASEEFSHEDYWVSFDFESTHYDARKGDLLTVALASSGCDAVYTFPFRRLETEEEQERVKCAFRDWLCSDCAKIVTEINMEFLWSWAKFGVIPKNIHRATEIMTHIADQRRGTNSLDWRALADFGVYYKDIVDRKNMAAEELDKVLYYNGLDAYYTLQLALLYEKKIKAQGQEKALDLLTKASYIYCKASVNGIKLDETVLDQVGQGFEKRKNEIVDELKEFPCVQEWDKAVHITHSLPISSIKPTFEGEIIPSARKQRGKTLLKALWTPTGQINRRAVLFDILGAPVLMETDSGEPSLSAAHMDLLAEEWKDDVGLKYVKKCQEATTIDTIIKSYMNLKNNIWPDGRIHPKFKLSVPRTYRSSSSDPNFQNQHKHGEGVALRKAFVPTLDGFLAADYGAMEVRVIAYLSQDKVLLKQLNDGFDLHAYWASKLWNIEFNSFLRNLKKDEYKEMRFKAKNMFVFPEFYGSWNEPISENIGLSVKRVRLVESWFWKEYNGVGKWHNKLEEQYKTDHGIYLPNGFYIPGPLTRNDIFNYPVQGPASHYVAASCIDLQQVYEEKGFESYLCGQIHDDIITDFTKGEVREVLKVKKEIMETPRFGLSGAPLLSEFSISTTNWHDMEDIG